MSNLNVINSHCYECNGVRVQEIGPDEYDIHFLNGDVKIVLDPRKPIALATGCGSGKTTAICLLMLLRLGKGSLYVTNLVDDLDRVYYWFRDNAFGKFQYVDSRTGQLKMFTGEDIINLHNSPIYEQVPVYDDHGVQVLDENGSPIFRKGNPINGVLIEDYRKDHSILKNYEIVLTTSHKFTNENPVDLTKFGDLSTLSFNRNAMSLQMRAMTGTFGSYPIRGGIFIDEILSKGVLKKTFSKKDIECLGEMRYNTAFDPDHPIIWYHSVPYEVFKYKFRDLLETSPDLVVSKSDPIKNDLIRDTIYGDYENIWRDKIRDNKQSEVIISNNLRSFIINGSRIPILFAEGTAEYLFLPTFDERTGRFIQNENFKLITYPNKYNSSINVEVFENPLTSRKVSRIEMNKLSNSGKSELLDRIDGLAYNIQMIINRPDVTKVLIFGWMNLKLNGDKGPSSTTVPIIRDLNDRFDLVEYMSTRILIPPGKEVKFSHYMSGLDKATNSFRDYDSIILAGYFRIPDDAVREKNEEFGYNADPNSFIMHQVIQAICRTRIRNHKGEGINIFLSDDWPDWVKVQIERHLSNKSIGMKVVIKDTTLDHIPNKWKEQVKSLMNFDLGFKNAIETKGTYTLNISLDEIYKLIPMSEKKISKYYSFIRYLDNSLGITVNISSRKTPGI